MGFLSDIFGGSSSGEGFQAIPDTEEQRQARQFLVGLLNRSGITFPTQNIPGMSDLERQAQGMVSNWAGQGTPAGITTAQNELTRTVQGGYDPYNSAEYRGYRDASRMEEENAVNSLRRSLQLQGMNASSPEIRAQGQTRRGYSADRMNMLGGLYNTERNRQLGATTALADVTNQGEQLTAQKAGAAATMGAVERQISTAQEQAIYDALMRTLLFPYQEQTNVAGTLLGEQRYMYNPGTTSPSIFSQVAGPLAMLGGASIMAGAGGGAAAGAAGGGSILAGMFASDQRLKTDVKPIESALDKVNALRGLTYRFKGRPPDDREAGIMAQDLEAVLPEGVVEIDGVKMVKISAVIGLLVSAVNELSEKIEKILPRRADVRPVGGPSGRSN